MTTSAPNIVLVTGGAGYVASHCCGLGASVSPIVAAAEHVTGRDVAASIVGRCQGVPARLVTDPRKGARVLGWRTEHSNVDRVLTHAWAWHQTRFGPGEASADVIAGRQSQLRAAE